MKLVNLLLHSMFIFAIFAVTGCGERYSREDFANMVKDKSPAEVQAKLGKPDAIDESVASTPRWTYESKTFFTAEGNIKFDPRAIVIFKQADSNATAKAAEVKYE